MPLVLARVLDRTRLSATGVWVDGRMDESQIGTIVLWLRIEHVEQRVRARNRAYKSIERHVLTPYGARRLPTGEHTVDFSYRPWIIELGAAISGVTACIIVALLAFALRGHGARELRAHERVETDTLDVGAAR